MSDRTAPPATARSQATFAAGCFWGVEDVFAHTPGVLDAVSGYTGGTVQRPSYEQVCDGDTGHAEAVLVTFDPAVVSYVKLLDIFWNLHDPTQVGGQGPDLGDQYRSAIFVHDAAQRTAATASLAKAQAFFARPITTRIHDAVTFWPAEDYHQDYFARRGMAGRGCHVARRGPPVVTAG